MSTSGQRDPVGKGAACRWILLTLYWAGSRKCHVRWIGEAVPKRTYQPKRIPRRRRHGFLHRMASTAGRRVIRSRRLKGRKRLVVV